MLQTRAISRDAPLEKVNSQEKQKNNPQCNKSSSILGMLEKI